MHADDVAQVQVGESLVGLLANLIHFGQQLDPSHEILDMGEGRFAHHADRDQSARKSDALGAHLGAAAFFGLLVERERLGRTVRTIEAALVGLDALRTKRRQLLAALQFLFGPLPFHSAKV